MIYLLLLLQQFIASTTHLVAKDITVELEAITVVLFRGIFTCIAFGIWMFVRRSSLRKVDRADIGLIALLGLVNIPINQLLFIWGVDYTTAPNASLAYALTPVFVVILLALWKRTSPGWRKMLGVALAVTGAAIVLVDRGASVTPEQTLGNLMVLAASVSWAAYTVIGRSLIVKYGPVQTTAMSFFAGLAWYIPVWALIPIHDPMTVLVSPGWLEHWAQLFYLGVITSGVGYGIWYYALSRMEASRVSVFNNLQPVLTSVLSFFIFGTIPTLMFVVGGAIAIAGVIVTQQD